MTALPVCLHCYEVFDPRMIKVSDCNLCPRMKCNHDLVWIDENMIPTIFELNRKGYITTDCCSAHLWDVGRISPDKVCDAFGNPETSDNFYYSLYIQFDINVLPPSVPNGFRIEMEHYKEFYDPEKFDAEFIKEKHAENNFRCSIRKRYNSEDISENPNPFEVQKYIFHNLNVLLDWAMSLPNQRIAGLVPHPVPEKGPEGEVQILRSWEDVHKFLNTPLDEDAPDYANFQATVQIFDEPNANKTIYPSNLFHKEIMNDKCSDIDDNWESLEEMTTSRRLKEELLLKAGLFQGLYPETNHIFFKHKDSAEKCRYPDESGWKQETPHLTPHINSLRPTYEIVKMLEEGWYETKPRVK